MHDLLIDGNAGFLAFAEDQGLPVSPENEQVITLAPTVVLQATLQAEKTPWNFAELAQVQDQALPDMLLRREDVPLPADAVPNLRPPLGLADL